MPRLTTAFSMLTSFKRHSAVMDDDNPIVPGVDTSKIRRALGKAPKNTQGRSRLCRLPYDIRLRIYKWALCKGHSLVLRAELNLWQGLSKAPGCKGLLSLPLTCRMIYEESFDIIYRSNTFYIYNVT